MSTNQSPAGSMEEEDETIAGDPVGGGRERFWTSGLLMSYIREPKHALLCCCCGCCGVGYTFGLTQERLSKGKRNRWNECCIYTLASCTIASCCLGWSNRFRMRKAFHIHGSMCGDYFAHTCCQPCAVIQEYRSVKMLSWKEGDSLWHDLGVQYILPRNSMEPEGAGE